MYNAVDDRIENIKPDPEIRAEAKRRINRAGLRLVEAMSQDEDEKLSAFRKFLDVFNTEYANYLYNLSSSTYLKISKFDPSKSRSEIANSFYTYAMEYLFYGKTGNGLRIYSVCRNYNPDKIRKDSEYPFFDYLRAYLWQHSVSQWNTEQKMNNRVGINVPAKYDAVMTKFNRYLAEHSLSLAECDLKEAAAALKISYSKLKEAVEANAQTKAESLDAPAHDDSDETIGQKIPLITEAVSVADENTGRSALTGMLDRLLRFLKTDTELEVFPYMFTIRIIEEIVKTANKEYCSIYMKYQKDHVTANQMLETERGWSFLDIDRRLSEYGCIGHALLSTDVVDLFKATRRLPTQKQVAVIKNISESNMSKVFSKIIARAEAHGYLTEVINERS